MGGIKQIQTCLATFREEKARQKATADIGENGQRDWEDVNFRQEDISVAAEAGVAKRIGVGRGVRTVPCGSTAGDSSRVDVAIGGCDHNITSGTYCDRGFRLAADRIKSTGTAERTDGSWGSRRSRTL